MYGPNRVRAPVGTGTSGTAVVEITTATQYPFEDSVRMTVVVQGDATSAKFPLLLRIPSWCAKPGLTVAGVDVDASTPDKVDLTSSRL